MSPQPGEKDTGSIRRSSAISFIPCSRLRAQPAVGSSITEHSRVGGVIGFCGPGASSELHGTGQHEIARRPHSSSGERQGAHVGGFHILDVDYRARPRGLRMPIVDCSFLGTGC